MKFLLASLVVASAFFVPGAVLADVVVTAAHESGDARKDLLRALRLTHDRDGIRHVLDAYGPRFWKELSHTGQRAAVDAIDVLLEDSPDTSGRSDLVARALRFARINDAIHDRASNATLIEILSPQLEEDLGYGRAPRSILERVAVAVLAGGQGRDGLYENLEAFESAYRDVTESFQSGR